MNPACSRMNAQTGFTLPEILIALALGLFLLAAVSHVYISALKSAAENQQQVRLNHNLRASLELILSDLKRAGGIVLPQGADGQDYAANPFMDSVSKLRLWDCDSGYQCRCVTYSYDLDRDASPYFGNSNHFGFKLNRSAIALRKGPAVDASGPHPGCGYDAAENQWEALTEEAVRITGFSISYTDAAGSVIPAPEAINTSDGGPCVVGAACLETRNLLVRISGAQGDFALSVAGRVRVRNDRYFIR